MEDLATAGQGIPLSPSMMAMPILWWRWIFCLWYSSLFVLTIVFFIGTCLRYFNLHQEFYGLTTASVLFLCRVLIHLYLGISDLLEQFSIRETHIKIKLSFVIFFCSQHLFGGIAGQEVMSSLLREPDWMPRKPWTKNYRSWSRPDPRDFMRSVYLGVYGVLKVSLWSLFLFTFSLRAFCNCKRSKKKVK